MRNEFGATVDGCKSDYFQKGFEPRVCTVVTAIYQFLYLKFKKVALALELVLCQKKLLHF